MMKRFLILLVGVLGLLLGRQAFASSITLSTPGAGVYNWVSGEGDPIGSQWAESGGLLIGERDGGLYA